MFEVTIIYKIYKKELENEGCPDVKKTLEKHFSSWFKKHVGFLSIYLISISIVLVLVKLV